MHSNNSGFSLIEVMVASALLAIWLPSSLYTLQLALAKQQQLQHRVQQAEAIMLAKSELHEQWLAQRPLAIQVEDVEVRWQLTRVDDHDARLVLTTQDYQAKFWLSASLPGVNQVESRR